MTKRIITALMLAALTGSASGAVFRVSPAGSDEGTGASWAQAKSLVGALAAAKDGDELWLMAGLYKGGVTVPAAVTVRGGFSGAETSAGARKFAAASEISGGEVAVKVTAKSGTVAFDQVTVMNGTRRGLAMIDGGASLVCSDCRFVDNRAPHNDTAWNAPIRESYGLCGRALAFIGTGKETLTLTRCVFTGNGEIRSPEMSLQKVDCRGMALFVASCAKAQIVDTTFSGNGMVAPDTQIYAGIRSVFCTVVGYAGAGISVVHIRDTSASFENTAFAGNRTGVSAGRGGQIVCLEGASGGSSFRNCVWKGNDALYRNEMFQYLIPTAAMYFGPLVLRLANESDTVTLDGCTFAYNIAFGGYTAGLNVQSGTAKVRQSVFWGNVASEVHSMHADLQAGYKGVIDIDASLIGAMDARLFDLTDPRIRFGSAMKVGNPDFATKPATILAALKNKANNLVSLTEETFPIAGRNGKKYDGQQGFNPGGYKWYDRANFDPATIDITRGPNAIERPAGPRTLTDAGDPKGENAYAKKALVIAPEPIYFQPWKDNMTRREDWDYTVGAKLSRGRTIQFFRHTADPAWHTDDWSAEHRKTGPNQCDTFALAKPSDTVGASERRPLVVILHSRGGSSLPHGVDDAALSEPDAGCNSVPDDSYALFLDCMENHKYDFWWGAMPPPAVEIKQYENTYYSCYLTPSCMNGELFWGPTEEPFTCCGKPEITNLDYILRGESACEKRVMDTIEWVVRKYNIDRNRICLAGNSMGGQGTLAIGLPHGDVFAALHANVPATIWFPAARMGFIDREGRDVPLSDFKMPAIDPPVVIDWSGSDDAWSRDHDILFRNVNRFKIQYLSWWGPYGHCGSIKKAREVNPDVCTFDIFSVKKNEAYPVFTDASSNSALPWPQKAWLAADGTGGKTVGGVESAKGKIVPRDGGDIVGQWNGVFRWEVLEDTPKNFKIKLWTESGKDATADVSMRRVQNFDLTKGGSWKYAGTRGKGRLKYDRQLRTATIPRLRITGEPRLLELER